MNDGDVVFEVIVRHNAVQAIRRRLRTPGMHIPESNLEVTSELARNHLLHGCIDGCYRSTNSSGPEASRFSRWISSIVCSQNASSRLSPSTPERSSRRRSTRCCNNNELRTVGRGLHAATLPGVHLHAIVTDPVWIEECPDGVGDIETTMRETVFAL